GRILDHKIKTHRQIRFWRWVLMKPRFKLAQVSSSRSAQIRMAIVVVAIIVVPVWKRACIKSDVVIYRNLPPGSTLAGHVPTFQQNQLMARLRGKLPIIVSAWYWRTRI